MQSAPYLDRTAAHEVKSWMFGKNNGPAPENFFSVVRAQTVPEILIVKYGQEKLRGVRSACD